MADQPDHSRRPATWRPDGPWEGWVECGCGARHWGRNGAAGLLIVREPETGNVDDAPPAPADRTADGGPARARSAVGRSAVLLQHRATWTHHGDTWGIPGGALHPGESAWDGAVREAVEEAGLHGAALTPLATSVLSHPDWSYTTVLARATGPLSARPTDAESAAIEWVDLNAVPDLPLLPAFAEAWPALTRMLSTRPVLVVDAANVVGSRPDGWWKDRAGATRRLLTGLDQLTAGGVPAALLDLPGRTWWPEMVLVTEGAARAVGPQESARVRIVPATGEGDATIVTEVRLLRAAEYSVSVVTADRALVEAVTTLGARVVGPRRLLELLPRA